jgi:hypothetical protein
MNISRARMGVKLPAPVNLLLRILNVSAAQPSDRLTTLLLLNIRNLLQSNSPSREVSPKLPVIPLKPSRFDQKPTHDNILEP